MGDAEQLIRPYEEADEREVVSLWHRSVLAAYPYLPTAQSLTREKAGEVFREVIRPGKSLWVGVQDGHIVAYLALRGSYIDRLYVDPAEWHQG
jgi:hypothetical protein